MHTHDEHLIYSSVEEAIKKQVEKTLQKEEIQAQIKQAVEDYLSPDDLDEIIDTVIRESEAVNEAISNKVIEAALNRMGFDDS